ncbi:MAG: hypothetical protein IPO92_12420 [Saprospiraceae bacterium]|nr:hypothetical protein [Saprospiraceae bacterium]
MSKNQMVRDIPALSDAISGHKSLLIPFSNEEMELLSLKQSRMSKKKGFVKMNTGIFETIYFESLIAYGIKTYASNQKLILISTSDEEFIYLTKDGKTYVYFDNQEVGILTSDGKLINPKNQVMASVAGNDDLPNHAVTINGNAFGYIINPKFSSVSTPRAFSLLRPMKNDERTLFLCLTLINLVEESQQ